MPQGLHHRDNNNIKACQKEGKADDAQGGNADGKHLLGCVEDAQKLLCEGPEKNHADNHNGNGIGHRKAHGFHQAVRLSCAVVEANDWHHAVVQTEYRHKDEALQLEVYAEYRRCRRGKANQNLIHAEGHHRADGCHADGRNPDGINALDCVCLQMIFFRIDDDIIIFLFIEEARQRCRTNLPDYSCDSRTTHPKPWCAEQPENQNRVQNDVHDCAKPLCQHGIDGSARCLQNTLKPELQKDCCGKQAADTQILCPQLHNFKVRGLRAEKQAAAENSEQCKHNPA